MFHEVVFGGGPLGVSIWIGLFCVSTAAFASVLILLTLLRRKVFLHPRFFEKNAGNAPDALPAEFETNSSLFDRIYVVLYPNSCKGKAALEELAAEIIGRESRRVLRKIAALQTCANVAPMLGLLGTVQGMVTAFMGLGTTVGPEKASVLAVAISQALYTTAAGLVIAIPATILCIVFRNRLETIMDALNEDIGNVIDSFTGDR